MNEGTPQPFATPWPDTGGMLRASAGLPPAAPDPGSYWQSLAETWAKWSDEWQSWIASGFVNPHSPPHDRRFAGSEWQTPYFAMVRDVYLATVRYWQQAVEAAE